jgi:glycerophosphoryl diester phosphodiesterase
MPAFQSAVDLGYRYIETDVQLTADGVLVAFHDNDLTRTTGDKGKISEMVWADVRRALVHGREPIPLFEDLMASFPEVRVNVDCKSDVAVDGLVAAIRRSNALDRICVGSFSAARLRRLRREFGPALCTSLGPAEVLRWRVGAVGPRGWPTPKLPCAQVPVRQFGIPLVTARMVRAAHALGIAVHVWTVDEATEMDRLLDLGVDGIMTDRPAVLKETLARRGQWH